MNESQEAIINYLESKFCLSRKGVKNMIVNIASEIKDEEYKTDGVTFEEVE